MRETLLPIDSQEAIEERFQLDRYGTSHLSIVILHQNLSKRYASHNLREQKLGIFQSFTWVKLLRRFSKQLWDRNPAMQNLEMGCCAAPTKRQLNFNYWTGDEPSNSMHIEAGKVFFPGCMACGNNDRRNHRFHTSKFHVHKAWGGEHANHQRFKGSEGLPNNFDSGLAPWLKKPHPYISHLPAI